jgi:hypothetical protein
LPISKFGFPRNNESTDNSVGFLIEEGTFDPIPEEYLVWLARELPLVAPYSILFIPNKENHVSSRLLILYLFLISFICTSPPAWAVQSISAPLKGEAVKSDDSSLPLLNDQDQASDQEPTVDQEPQTEALETEEKQEPAAADAPARSQLKSSELLPPSTRAWVSIPDLERFEAQFDKTQIGQLAADPDIKPFFESAKKQMQDFMDEKNLRTGLRIEEISAFRSGELCIAGVLQDLEGGQPARGSHGVVLLVDVTGKEEKAQQAILDINAELVKKSGGKLEPVEISGVEVTKYSAQNPKRIRQIRSVFQTVHNGWLLVADNEEIFRDILRRLSAPEKINPAATLGMAPSFTTIMNETELFGETAELSWYVDPFGYLQLAQKLYEEEQEFREHHNDWTAVLRDNGFDAVKGIGGNVGISLNAKDQELESLSRTFIYAPKDNLNGKHQRFFDLVDFSERKEGATEPHDLISNQAGGFFGGSWQFTKLLNSAGFIYDSVIGKEGEFKRLIADFKKEPEFQVDIPRLVGMLDDQLIVFSGTERPISPTSERAAIAIPLKEDADAKYVMDSLRKMAKGGTAINLGGITVIEVDTTIEPEIDPIEVPPGFEEGFDDDLDEEKKPEKRFNLFEKRYMVVHHGMLIVANEKQFMRQLLGRAPSQKLRDAKDYQSVKSALEGLTDNEKVVFRRFIRLDRALEVNYNILRQGEMAGSSTMIGRLLNKLHESENRNPGELRKQKLDGSKLPEDYQNEIAPHLGATGWVTELEEHGWRITGCLIRKEDVEP